MDWDGKPISGWDATVRYIDKETDAPPKDIRESKPTQLGTAIKIFQVYETAEFRDLKLGVNLL